MSLRVVTDFEGSCLGEWQITGNALYATLFNEKMAYVDGAVRDYNGHFVFGLRNEGSASETLKAQISNGKPPARALMPLRLFTSHDPTTEFQDSGLPLYIDGGRWNEFEITLAPGETVYVSNTQWRPYPYLMAGFEQLAKDAGFERFVYGKSYQGRELVAYCSPGAREDNNTRPRFLVSSGLHPMEPDTWGPEAILERLVEPGKRGLLDDIDVILAPIPNPDGFVLGYNGITANEINMLWDFRYRDAQACPEAAALFQLVQHVRPWVYIDFHCYTVHGATKVAGPYFKPASYYAGEPARRLADRVSKAVGAIPDTKTVIEISPSASFSQLTRETNVVTVAKYHLHIDWGKERSKQLGWEVFSRAANAARSERLTRDDLLFAPYGKRKKSLLDRARYAGYWLRFRTVRLAANALRPLRPYWRKR